jgi:signal transduction histidine kinase
VEVWGFLGTHSNRTVLEDAYFELVGGSGRTETADIVAKPPPVGAPITDAREIRRMSREQANEGRIARLRGVLTYADPAWRVVFLQTTNDAIFLDTDQPDLRPGQYVEVTGQTQEGGFAPQLVHCTTEILATTNLPTPVRITLKDTADGFYDSHWIEIEGSVRRISKESDHISMTLTSPEGRFAAVVFDPGPAPAPVELVDAIVTLRGACGSQVNSRGQLNGITVEVPNRDQIRIIDASPADPFTVAPTPISKVATFHADARSKRRVKVSGIVSLVAPDRTFFLQDGSAGIRVQTAEVGQVHAGQPLEAVGFPALMGFSPHLEDALVRPAGLGKTPTPVRTEAAAILKTGQHDGMLVELEAELLQSATKAAHARFLLQDGSVIFTAQMALPTLRQSFPEMAPGSLVRVRGVCVIQGTENREPSSFHLLLPDAGSIRVVQSAPWWTLRHTLLLAGGIAVGGLIAALWVISLRRQVRAQTEIIQRNQRELMEASRQAGMAEIATSVLHNVGNVLNSVNVSATVASDRLKSSSIPMLSRTVDLMEQHREELGEFITSNPRGKNLPPFLKSLAARLQEEKAILLKEMDDLRNNIEHIKQIVAMQQGFARASTLIDAIEPIEIIEDALRINASGLTRAGIKVKRDFDPSLGNVCADKHKLLQILVNLIRNAENACAESGTSPKEIVLSAVRCNGRVEISVQDNGVGIPSENLTRIFSFGFTTRENGHGFGLHSSALAAKEMGARLTVRSDGPGQGARFTIEMPVPEAATSTPNGVGGPVGL